MSEASTFTSRVAKELNWTEQEVKGLSLQSIRELLPEGSELRAEASRLIRSGEYMTTKLRSKRR